MKETPFDTDIADNLKILQEVQERVNKLKQSKAEYLSPFKVGDVIVSATGKRAKITRIQPGYGFGEGYCLIARLFIKSGKELGTATHELYQREWGNAVKVSPQ